MSTTSRAYGTGHELVLMQGRVEAETREMARQRAAELGISMAIYLDRLVRYEAQHRPLMKDDEPYTQERLSA